MYIDVVSQFPLFVKSVKNLDEKQVFYTLIDIPIKYMCYYSVSYLKS